jgi:Protein of unknown function (DUF3443)
MALGVAICVAAVSCGGGGGGGGGGTSRGAPPTPPNNMADLIVDEGPSNNSVNTLFVTITLCVPGTTDCQSIDHVLVDTGSYGLRILAPVLNLTLPVITLASGQSLAECVVFVDGYSWGPVEMADLQIAGETASSLPFQAIGDPRFAKVPADCSDMAKSEEDTVKTFGANGILGIGPFAYDCPACADVVVPGTYYACSSASSCVGTMVPLSSQVPNPETRFAVDNNGSIIQLSSVASAGQLTVTGTLTFGVDTQSNNQSGSETVLAVDQNAELTVTFKGQPLSQSFIDSGSNGIFFSDSAIPACAQSGYTDFYCPTNTLSLELSMQGENGVMANNIGFSVGNAQTMLANNPNFNAFPALAGPNQNPNSFDFGLAFFYGKRVAIVVEGRKTSVGTGPYIAF